MKLYRGQQNLTALRGTALSIGNFDGVHRGHQQLLKRLKHIAQEQQCKAAAMLFEPQPFEFFAKDKAEPRLMRFREKWLTLQSWDLDGLICLPFNKRLAAISADDFIQHLLIDTLGVSAVIIGDDFRFGAKRAGDFGLLAQAGKQHGFIAEQIPTYLIDNERVSSTRVRRTLQQGQLAEAKRLLGRAYCLSGKVAYGDQQGRRWGCPTANFHVHRRAVPLQGVFVVQVHGLDNKPWPGVANLGTRPAVGGKQVLLEVHLFDFSGDLYGKELQVEFLHKLRDEKNFDTIDLLITAIKQDVTEAKQYWANSRAQDTPT